MDSVHHIRMDHGDFIYGCEVVFTLIFSVEYVLRVACLRRPREYVLSAMGIVDISSIVPTFVSTFYSIISIAACSPPLV
jgi:voltage-gated potassium channel